MTTNNTIITQEIIHSLKNLKSKKGGMILKIDLEKAYDRINWSFLTNTLKDFNFPEKWVELIMNCVMYTSMSILWNGSPLPDFKPTRGLRQGDPLSPYLFVLCMEKLSHMIHMAVEERKWKGLRASKNGPNITHLFYADDLMIFAEADESACRHIMDALNHFCGMSGQKINFKKSSLFVSKNVKVCHAKTLSNICGIPLTDNLGIYLGIPMVHKRKGKQHFNHIIHRMQMKLSGWKAKNLSFAGRTTLIKSVLSTLPAYNMQTNLLPAAICDQIDKINRNFLWGDSPDKKKIHLIKWERVCGPIAEGGLGIRDTRTNNLANLLKLGWRLIENCDGLWARVLKAKYTKSAKVYDWNFRNNASHIWKGIWHTRTFLQEGTKWNVGDGKRINFAKDWWCGEGPLINRVNGLNTKLSVNDVLKKNFNPFDNGSSSMDNNVQNEINQIHLPEFCSMKDQPYWASDSKGKFTIKSMYNVIRGSNLTPNPALKVWTGIWKLKIPQKLKNFLWLTQHDRILSNKLRCERHLADEATCLRCRDNSESTLHILRDCPKAKAIWNNFSNDSYKNANANLDIPELLSLNLFELRDRTFNGIDWPVMFAVIIWQIWKDRNKESIAKEKVCMQVSSKNIMEFAKEIK